MATERPYAKRDHPGNSARWRKGKRCITPGCKNEAGTSWSPLWCFRCNVKRMDKINARFAAIESAFGQEPQA